MGYRTHQYPKFQRAVNLVFFVVSLLMVIAIWVFLAINLWGTDNRIVSDPSTVPASIVLALMVGVVGLYVNMLAPAIRVQDDGFQLKTIFYQSQWLQWEAIRFIDEHWQSGKRLTMYSIGVDNVHPIYSLVGLTQLMGGPGFVLTSKIHGYQELMQLLKTNRAELVQGAARA